MITTISFTREDCLLTASLLQELNDYFKALDETPILNPRVVFFTSKVPSTFCGGADYKSIGQWRKKREHHKIDSYWRGIYDLMGNIANKNAQSVMTVAFMDGEVRDAGIGLAC